MNLEQLGRFLIIFAVVLAIIGVLVFLIGKGLGIGRLPGDILIQRGRTKIFIPIVTSILLSIILTFVLNLILYFLRRP